MLKSATDSPIGHQVAIAIEMEDKKDCLLLIPVALSAKATAVA